MIYIIQIDRLFKEIYASTLNALLITVMALII